MKHARDKNGLKFIRHTCAKTCNDQCYPANWRQGGRQELITPIFYPSIQLQTHYSAFGSLIHLLSLSRSAKYGHKYRTFFPPRHGEITKKLYAVIKRDVNFT